MEFIKVDNNFKDKEKIYELNDEAFPNNERIPSKRLIKYCLKFNCDFWAVYEKEEFVGFIVILPDKEFQIAYIWFLAVDNKYRSQGLGTKILKNTNKKYNKFKLILDLEKIDQTAKNNEQRKRRINFYQKNGYVRTNFGMKYLGVDYEILCSDGEFDNKQFQRFINKYQLMGFGYGKIYAI